MTLDHRHLPYYHLQDNPNDGVGAISCWRSRRPPHRSSSTQLLASALAPLRWSSLREVRYSARPRTHIATRAAPSALRHFHPPPECVRGCACPDPCAAARQTSIKSPTRTGFAATPALISSAQRKSNKQPLLPLLSASNLSHLRVDQLSCCSLRRPSHTYLHNFLRNSPHPPTSIDSRLPPNGRRASPEPQGRTESCCAVLSVLLGGLCRKPSLIPGLLRYSISLPSPSRVSSHEDGDANPFLTTPGPSVQLALLLL